jgi:two-component system, cell cycle sensor histidine kinase and response regulator CckA
VRKRTERLQKSLEQESVMLRTLIDNLPDGIFLKDKESRFIFANQVIAELMGAPDPSALTGKTDHDFYPREVADVFLADERSVMESRRRLVNREESESMSGKLRWLTTKVPLVDARGEVTGLFGITRDITERHEAEEKLRRSEQRYRDLLEQAADGIFLLDENGNFLMANAAICEMLGHAREELLRLNILDTYPDELRDMAMARLYEIKSGRSMRFERTMKRKDGSVIAVEMSAKRLADRTMQGIAHDITERLEHERAIARLSLVYHAMSKTNQLIAHEKNRQRLLEGICRIAVEDGGALMAWVGFVDLKTKTVVPTAWFGKEEGYLSEAVISAEDVPLGRGPTGIAVRENRHVFTADIASEPTMAPWRERALRRGYHSSAAFPLTEKGKAVGAIMAYSGEVGFFNSSAVALLDELAMDISYALESLTGEEERKKAEERNLSLARFVDENPHPVMRVTPEGSLIYANKASEPLTSSWARGGDRKVSREYLRALTDVWETGEKQEIEIHEGPKSYIVTFVPFAAAGYINLYGRDVTEERALAQRFNQAQKMEAIGQLTGGVAHDFNNLLQVITGYCELLNQKLPEENQKYVAEITKAAQRAEALITQLLAFSRKQALRPQVVDTKDLIRSMQKMLERVIGEDVELRTFIDPDTGNFLADPGQMEQVLLNLAVNARDAMPSGGKLTLETSNRTFDEGYIRDHLGAKTGQYVCIAVSDTGVGMDQETLSHIYEPFFTTKEKGKGTGLGLSTVYGIIKQSDGYINCYSEPGKGTTFTIYLPFTSREAGRRQVAASGTTAPRGTETILIVDDESAVRSVARIALEQAGYVVIEASGGEEALSAVLAHSITVALLVTDVVMPRISGKELSLKLKEICPSVKVLYISGYTANVVSHHGILDAGVDFLQKPFSSLEFLAKVREILDRP